MKRVSLLAAISIVALSACSSGTMNPASAPGAPMHTLSNATDALLVDPASVLNQLPKNDTIGSAVDPINGDQNPYGLDIAKVTAGKLTAGDLVICNFNNSANIQGTGTTIVALHPVIGSKPTRITQFALLNGCDEVALGSNDNIWASSFTADRVTVYNPAGGFIAKPAGPWANPFGITFSPPSGRQIFYESNAKNGTIVRISRTADGASFVFETIASGFAVNHGLPGSILGPSGLQYDRLRDRLYIVDGTNNTVVGFRGVSTIPAGGVRVNSDGKTFSGPFASRAFLVFAGAPLNGPISSALLFNGNLVIGNTLDPTGKNLMVELTPLGQVLAVRNIDTGAAGAIFGMIATGTSAADTKLYYNDDNANALMVLEH